MNIPGSTSHGVMPAAVASGKVLGIGSHQEILRVAEKLSTLLRVEKSVTAGLSGRSCGLRRGSAAARLLRLWVRIPPEAWMFDVSVVCCQVEVSATS